VLDAAKAQKGLVSFWYRLKLGGDRRVLLRMQTQNVYVGNLLMLFDDIDGELLPICEVAISPVQWSSLLDRGRLAVVDGSIEGLDAWAAIEKAGHTIPESVR
jgi:hypothetical protein